MRSAADSSPRSSSSPKTETGGWSSSSPFAPTSLLLRRVRTVAELLVANHVLVGPMNEAELRRSIEGPVKGRGPAGRAGARGNLALESGLKDRPGRCPCCSAALLDLWQRRIAEGSFSFRSITSASAARAQPSSASRSERTAARHEQAQARGGHLPPSSRQAVPTTAPSSAALAGRASRAGRRFRAAPDISRSGGSGPIIISDGQRGGGARRHLP